MPHDAGRIAVRGVGGEQAWGNHRPGIVHERNQNPVVPQIMGLFPRVHCDQASLFPTFRNFPAKSGP